jgi:signal transduction histidine kinase
MASSLTREASAGTAGSSSDTEQAQLRFAPQILARLGEELNPNPDQGVLELVRNAYDADADRCRVTLIDISEPGGSIEIRDWGSGLSRHAIEDGWLVLGRSAKQSTKRTEGGRLQVGSKGLGRLAALRQGHVAEMTTWPRTRRGARTTRTGHTVTLNWAEFDEAETVDEVAVDINTIRAEQPVECGTEIVVQNLRARWTRPEVKRLARALLLLGDPFGSAANTFEVELVCPEHPDLESLVAGSYFDYSYYSILARLDENGQASLRLQDNRLGIDDAVGHDEIAGALSKETGAYSAVPAEFELHGFLRSSEALQGMGSAATLEGLRAWLDAYGGVHIFHRGLRVAPYGDTGFDWLDMNLLRARNPEHRPSTNNAVGRMVVEDAEGVLQQKTDRSGFIEDQAFLELRRFAQDVLEWAGRRRTKIADEQRERAKRQGPRRTARAKDSLTNEIEKLPRAQQKAVRTAVRRYEKAAEKDNEELRNDLLLYRTLATIGTTSAQIAHETYNPALAIVDLAEELEEIARQDLEDGAWDAIEPPVQQIDVLAKRLRDYARLPRVLLSAPKRRMRVFAADVAISDTVAVFEPLMNRHQVTVTTSPRAPGLRLRGPSALLDAILANLLINAMHALDGKNDGPRAIEVTTAREDDWLVLEVADSGHGIEDLDTDEIWVPGATTTPDGTGLGLTIVRDSANQLGGTVAAIANGPLGGAHFTIRLPVAL